MFRPIWAIFRYYVYKKFVSFLSPLSPPVSEPLTYRAVLLSTLLQDILNTSHHLLNVLLQLENILGLQKKLHGLSPRANYTDRATAACRRSDCQLVRIEGAT
jgi:hypothetical protein